MELSSVFQLGFLMGLLGSVHCIGMCGPLVMALPISTKNNFQKISSLLLYLLGKILSYALLGILFGLFGSQFRIFSIQSNISFIIGLLMLLYVFYMFVFKYKHFQIHLFNKTYNSILKLLSKLFKSKFVISFLFIGMLNGLLPCGMIYLALSWAVVTRSAVDGGLLMAFFGMGTIPALILVAIGGQFMGFVFRKRIQKLLPVFIFGIGVLLILRGLNLGIPYISPVAEIGNDVIPCHN
jgi:sulfite exporter TauE/SafE